MKTLKKIMSLVMAITMLATMVAFAGAEEDYTITPAGSNGPLSSVIVIGDYVITYDDAATYNGVAKTILKASLITDNGLKDYAEIVTPIAGTDYAYSTYWTTWFGDTLFIMNKAGGPDKNLGGFSASYINAKDIKEGVNYAKTFTLDLVPHGNNGDIGRTGANLVLRDKTTKVDYWYSLAEDGTPTLLGPSAMYAVQYTGTETKDGNHFYKKIDDNTTAIYSASMISPAVYDTTPIAVLDTYDLYDLKTIFVTDRWVIGCSNEYKAGVRNYVYRWDLEEVTEDGVLTREYVTTEEQFKYTLPTCRIPDIKVMGDLVMVLGQDTKRIYMFDIAQNFKYYTSETGTSIDGNGGTLWVADNYFLVDMKNGMNFWKVDMPKEAFMYVESENYIWNNDYTALAAKVEIDNPTSKPLSGKVVLASYVGEKLIDISIKDLSVAKGDSNYVITDEIDVPEISTLKAFYWTADGNPIISEFFMETTEE